MWSNDNFKKTVKTVQGIDVDAASLSKNACITRQPIYPQGVLATDINNSELSKARRKTISNPSAAVIGIAANQRCGDGASVVPSLTAQAVLPYMARNNAIYAEYANLQNNLISRGSVYKNNTIQSRSGYMAEEWTAGTYNLDAAIKDKADRAVLPKSTADASPDVLFDGKEASLKFYKDAKSSADAQTNTKYGSQVRIVPEDQAETAKSYLCEKSQKNTMRGRENAAKIQRDTANLIDDRIRSDSGAESTPLSKKDADKLASAISGNNDKTVVDREKINEVLKDTKVTKKKKSAVLKNKLTGIGVAAAIGLGTGFTIGFLAALAQNGLNPNSLKYAFASGAKQGAQGMVSSAGGAAIGMAVEKTVIATLKLTENVGKMVNIGVVGSLTVLAFSIYEFARLKRMGYSTKESLIRVGKSAALSMAIIVLTIVAQGIWKDPGAMAVSITAGIVLIGASLAKIIIDKETSKRIMYYTIALTKPSFV